MVVIAIGAIVALLWGLGGFREGFTGNPIPTLTDFKSISGSFSGGHFTMSGTPSSTLTSVFNWFKANVPFPTGTTDADIYGTVGLYGAMNSDFIFGTNDMTPFVNFVSAMPSGGTVEDNMTKVINFVNTTYKQTLKASDFIQTINAGQTSPVNDISDINGTYWGYVYLFGKPGSPSTPSPASSSSTQPMTIGVPSPCRPSYKSIPGGSMEFKCFN
jgi:hypothetical protein